LCFLVGRHIEFSRLVVQHWSVLNIEEKKQIRVNLYCKMEWKMFDFQ
jgi:hypothetical protein